MELHGPSDTAVIPGCASVCMTDRLLNCANVIRRKHGFINFVSLINEIKLSNPFIKFLGFETVYLLAFLTLWINSGLLGLFLMF